MQAISGAELVAVEPDVVRLAELVAEIRRVLAAHNVLEESEGRKYHEVDRLLAPAEAEVLVERLRATPDPEVAPYFDDPRVHGRIAQLLRDAWRGRLPPSVGRVGTSCWSRRAASGRRAAPAHRTGR